MADVAMLSTFVVILQPEKCPKKTVNYVESSPFTIEGYEVYIKITKCLEKDEETIKMHLKGIRCLSSDFHLTVYVFKEDKTVPFPSQKIRDLGRLLWATNLDYLRQQLTGIEEWNLNFRCVFQKESNYRDQSIPGHNFERTLQRGLLTGYNSQEELSATFARLLRQSWSSQDSKVKLAKNIYKATGISSPGHKEECIKFLVEQLTPESACEYLVFANDDDLKEKVIAYIINQKIPLTPVYWDTFNEQYPREANEVLLRMVRG